MRLKSILLGAISLATIELSFSQSVGVGITTPDSKAQLDISSSSKGVLIPRLTTPQRTGIVNPPKGLMVYDSTSKIIFYHDGSTWQGIASLANTWSLNGNSSTNPANQFIGTNDNNPLLFRTNNIKAGQIDHLNHNVLFGSKAAYNMPASSTWNTIIGDSAFYSVNQVTSGNTVVGFAAQSTSVGSPNYNVVVGINAGSGNEGYWTTIIGTDAGLYNKAWGNVYVGSSAGKQNTTGAFNTFVGDNAGREDSIGGYNSIFGAFAGQSNQGSENSFFGTFAGTSNDSASRNTGIGASALGSNTRGQENTAVGNAALSSNSTASGNTAVGVRALQLNTTASGNTAVGTNALKMTNSGANSALGVQALEFNSTGYSNTAMGFYALRNCTGYSNTAHGAFASERNWTGNFNTSIGMIALQYNETGNYNTAVGYGSGTNGSWNNTVSIGNYGWVNAYHNQVFLGNNSTSWIGGYVPWSVYSDGRIKKNITEEVKGLDFIIKLRPVTYYADIKVASTLTNNVITPDYANKYDIEKIKFSGFIAQEVEAAANECNYQFSGIKKARDDHDLYTLSYETFVVPLVKAVQEQQVQINSKQTQIEDLKKQSASQQEQINRLEKLIKDLQIVSRQ